MTAHCRGPLIAVVGCDGSGKSTVSAALVEFAQRFAPVCAVHLGKQSGNVGRAIARWPIVGRKLDQTIVRQTDRTRGERGLTNPKPLAAFVVYAFLVRRRRRFARMLKLWRGRTIIIADRFPQVDVPGAYDGPLLVPSGSGGPLVRWLARREHHHFAWMVGHRPDLVIRLNVDLKTAAARKPDHRYEALRRKVEATPRFTFGGATIVEVDSTRPLDDVVEAARTALAKVLTHRGYVEDGSRDRLA